MNEENLKLYNEFRAVPPEALKTIGAGRLKGMSDINPMWRIKKLTEAFGMCGIGWKYIIKEKRLEKGCKEQISAFVDIDLFVKVDGVWSDAICGTGGSSFVASETAGLYQSDECFKMALTDALSVACKAIGIGADVYFAKDRTKYDTTPQTQPPAQIPAPKRDEKMIAACNEAKSSTSEPILKTVWEKYPQYQKDNTFITAVNMRKSELTKK